MSQLNSRQGGMERTRFDLIQDKDARGHQCDPFAISGGKNHSQVLIAGKYV